MVIGAHPYQFISEDFHKPLVVTGFEPLDILQSLAMLVDQIADGRCEVENQYKRVVADEGNLLALKALGGSFELKQTSEWRGLGNCRLRVQLTQATNFLMLRSVFRYNPIKWQMTRKHAAVRC